MSAAPIRNLLSGQTLSDSERERLLHTARRLCQAAQQGARGAQLQGRHVAIAVARPRDANSDPLETAATRLGARVSFIGRRALADVSNHARMGRMLGSLYDAVDCAALSPEEARELQRLSGVPVFDGLAGDGHPIRALVPALQDAERELAPEEALASLLQAALLETMS